MKDLMISYDNKNGERVHKVYGRIFDFTDAVEQSDPDAPANCCSNVIAYFFENPLTRQEFDTVEDLYYHCVAIMS